VGEGAAFQAAWALDGGAEPPRWEAADTELFEDQPLAWLRERYHEYRDVGFA
jgi:xylulokinase